MQNSQPTLQHLLSNTASMVAENVKKVLILYQEKIFNLGDCYIRFNKLRCLRQYFTNASIDMNFPGPENEKFYDSLLKNNPHLDNITIQSWEQIDFSKYDVLISVTYNEPKLLEFLHAKYGDRIRSGSMPLSVLSISQLTLNPPTEGVPKYIFPVNAQLVEFLQQPMVGELYISDAERQWGDRWLEQNGVQKNDHVFIVIDTTSRKDKMLDFYVYYEFLTFLLSIDNAKILFFDERNAGKEIFYKEFVGEKYMRKIIFSRGMKLRQDLAIISSRYIRLVFGPCSGLLHCASGIYNNYVHKGMPAEDVPLLMTYTGKYYGEEKNARLWWGTAPLMNALMLRQRNGKKEMVILNDLPEEEKDLNDPLPCSEYTADMLKTVVERKLIPVFAL